MCEICKKIKAQIKETKNKIDELEHVDALIDADMVKTMKAMFYEEVLTIYRSARPKTANKERKDVKSNKKTSGRINKEDRKK